MGIFDVFKKQLKVELKPKDIIRSLIEDIPEILHEQREYKNCVDYLEHNEWGLALESLIELAEESGHFFPQDFWNELAEAAEKMKMSSQSSYCKEQIIKTKQKINWNFSKGITVEKFNDNSYSTHISQKLKNEWADQRREKDKLNSFINKEGFHISKGGREGTLYYIKNGRVCEIYYEMSGVPEFDILLWFNALDSWSLPTKQELNVLEKEKIEEELIVWLKKENIKAQI